MADDFKALNDALNLAVDTGDASALLKALASGADLSQWLQTAAESAVMLALMSKSTVEVLEILRAAGLDMAQRSPEHSAAGKPVALFEKLLLQSLFGSVPTAGVASYLLSLGADPNRRVYGRPLLGAFLCRGADIDVAVLDALLAAGPDIDATDADGATALMHAACRHGSGRAEALERLLACGADPARRDHQGRSAADRAAALPAPAYLEVFRRHLQNAAGANASPVAVRFPAQDMAAGSFFVLEPIGAPLTWRWSAAAEDAAAALRLIETRYGTSRPPIGPFPTLQLVAASDRGGAADPYAARHAGQAAPGNLLVLCLTAYSPKEAHDPQRADPRPIFVVTGVFGADARDAAQALAESQRGWSLVARLESLTLMTDGYADPVASVKTD